MARGRGGRGRGRGRSRSRSRSRSKSKSKSTKSKSRRRSTAASKRRRVRSVAKAKRAANRSPSKSKTTKKKSRKPMGRSRHTKGGQHAANKNQNKKAKRTVRSVSKSLKKRLSTFGKKVGDISSKVKKGFSIGKDAYGKALKGVAANAATHIANSQYNKQLKQANWTKRDMTKLTPQQQRKYDRLSKITGRDYSTRIPGMRINLSADRLAQFGGFADSGWYKGITKAIPGIKKLKINKQLYSNPLKKGWHSSQRMGRGHGVKEGYKGQPIGNDVLSGDMVPGSWLDFYDKQIKDKGPEPDWLGDVYRAHNISGGNLDEEARNYWSSEAKTKGRDAVIQSIIGTSKAQGTYGGRSKNKPMKKQSTSQSAIKRHKQTRARRIPTSMLKALSIRGGV